MDGWQTDDLLLGADSLFVAFETFDTNGSSADEALDRNLRSLLPFIARLALQAEALFPHRESLVYLIPSANASCCSSVSLSKRQCACLLAHAFLGTMPPPPPQFTQPPQQQRGAGRSAASETLFLDLPVGHFYPFSFQEWYQTGARGQPEKVKCLLAYFATTQERAFATTQERAQRGAQKIGTDGAVMASEGGAARGCEGVATRAPPHDDTKVDEKASSSSVVSFCRRTLTLAQLPDWASSQMPLAGANGVGGVEVIDVGAIEEAHGTLQADFANQYIGGGVLGRGCVQEEIRFVISPEALLSVLFTPRMRSHEAVVISGTEQYSEYAGYGSSFQFASRTHANGANPRAGAGEAARIIAIDAINFSQMREGEQYKRQFVFRELNKAYIGFSAVDTTYDSSSSTPTPTTVATGNWGSGVFGGDPQLKALLQWAAAAVAGEAPGGPGGGEAGARRLRYFPFGDQRLRRLAEVAGALVTRGTTVGELISALLRIADEGVQSGAEDVFAFVELVLLQKYRGCDGAGGNRVS
jgi:hypothetical protein